MSYIGTEPKDIRSFGRTKFDYTATQGQTAFTGADDDGKVLAFTVGQIEVYVNGILMDDSDFTTTGTGTVTLVSAANLNDVISIVSFETNIPDSNYVPASGGTFTGNVTHSGTLTANGAFTSLGIDDNATSTAMTLDTSGNVGIGGVPTNASDHKSLALFGNANNGAGFIEFNDTSGNADAAIFADNGTLILHADYDNATASSKIVFRVDGSTQRVIVNTNSLTVDPNSVGNHYGVFNTSSSGDGHILLQRSAANKYQVGSDTSNNFFIYNYAASGYALKIDTSNNFFVPTMAVGGTANLHWSSGNGQFFVTSSSKRFKHDIVDYDKGLAEVLQMQPKYFVYNEEPNEKQRAGFIAEDFHDIGMTEYVEYWQDENGEDIPSEIGYSNMVAVLVKAIQELSAKNDALETKVETLETQNTTQATQIADLITRVTALEEQ